MRYKVPSRRDELMNPLAEPGLIVSGKDVLLPWQSRAHLPHNDVQILHLRVEV
jgi:hypothetical protein